MRSSLVVPVTAPGANVTSVLPTFVIVEPASSANGESAGPSVMADAPWLHDKIGVAVGVGDGDGVGDGVGEGVGTGLGVGVWNAGTVQLLPHPPPPLHATKAAGAIRASNAASRRTLEKRTVLSMFMILI